MWNQFVIQEIVFSSLKRTYFIASTVNKSEIQEVSEFSDSQFLEKCKKSLPNCQNASQIVNCEWLIRTLNLLMFFFQFSKMPSQNFWIMPWYTV